MRALTEGIGHSSLEYFEIIFGMLSPLVGFRIAIQSFLPPRIVFHAGGEYLAAFGIDYKGTGRVTAIVQSDYVFLHKSGD